MKSRGAKNEKTDGNLTKSEPMGIAKKKMKKSKNMLDAFAKARSKNGHYNPALIKKQRESYKNAKNVKKFQKFLKQQIQQDDPSSSSRLIESENEPEDNKDMNKRTKRNGAFSLEELYKKKHEELEKERMDREAAIRAKKEEREKAEARRKAMREKMLKKTRTGQPVMKYRIEHLLETIQGSSKNSADKKS